MISGGSWIGSARLSGLIWVSLFALGIYCTRLDLLPICGEEPRWAGGAIEMLDTGDWVVPRQQGQVFPERPPFSSWAMAASAALRGQMDAWAIRLPSSLGVWLNALVVTIYAGHFLGRTGALAAGLIYTTFGQVMQLGRMGESEALFACFFSSGLMLWHLLYVAGRPRWQAWTVGYGLVALAALVKGIQAPVYFVLVSWAFVVLRRERRELLRWPHLVGLFCFVAIVGAWQIPFYLATDWNAVVAIWWGLAGDRFANGKLLSHLVTYPLETGVCLLPWSCLLVLLVYPDIREKLRAQKSLFGFLVLALVLTYPSVWLAASARGRYYMPLYPLIAVLIGGLVELASAAPAESPVGRSWARFLRGGAWFACLAAGVLILAHFVPRGMLGAIAQPLPFTICFALLCVPLGLSLGYLAQPPQRARVVLTLLVFGAVFGVVQTSLVFNVLTKFWNDPRPSVAAVLSRLPDPRSLVSFGPADHRFIYFYGSRVRELPWPTAVEQLPDEVTYFCYERHACDTPQQRINGRGRSWGFTPGTLPFAWEEVAVVNCERRLNGNPWTVTVVGKITDHRVLAARAARRSGALATQR